MTKSLHVLMTVASIIGVALIFSSCGEDEEPFDAEPAIVVDGGPYDPTIDPANFTEPVQNPYWPLRVGDHYVYEGVSDGEPERIVVTVTAETRVVMGVTCVVVQDDVYEDGELVETTQDWFATDNDGNVWYFGEDTKEVEDGVVVSTHGAWEAGVDGALPGIVMWANPMVGDAYRQEYYEGEAEDMAEVLSLTASETTPLGSYTDMVKTKEWTPLDPEPIEEKYYAKDIGFVLEVKVRGGVARIALVEFTPGG
ncbi:MAG: hypothetical protein O3A46_03285 [Candidatus Poribacteria bacterium]|nr:hypothetical protein [Candidatus Poribacteria bacterium]